ncbi:DUF4129 domain-containing protein [Desertihabitans aurantiacus]|uniref:DUF4129 domain-containing protein n=1 Tax=Desertihabitans aurantiacus TaxID=2282477 RepID=UPI000DF81739|nr:DUF4129 domain-containing protein [Desertihabitans aurantiacus]
MSVPRLLPPLDVPIAIGREEARRRAAEELGVPLDQPAEPGWLDRLVERLVLVAEDLADRSAALVERVLRWLGEVVRRLTDLSPGAGGDAGGGLWPTVLVVLGVAGLALLVWRVGLPRLNRTVGDAEVRTEAGVSPQEYRSLAERAAARGDLLTAVLEEFRAMVRGLEELTVIDPRPSRTALEVAWRAAEAVPEAEADLRSAATLFNEVAYGRRAPSPERWQQLRTLSEAVLGAAGRADLSRVPG